MRWKDIEVLDDGGQIHLFGRGAKRRTVRVSAATLDLVQKLGRDEAENFVSLLVQCPFELVSLDLDVRFCCEVCKRATNQPFASPPVSFRCAFSAFLMIFCASSRERQS